MSINCTCVQMNLRLVTALALSGSADEIAHLAAEGAYAPHAPLEVDDFPTVERIPHPPSTPKPKPLRRSKTINQALYRKYVKATRALMGLSELTDLNFDEEAPTCDNVHTGRGCLAVTYACTMMAEGRHQCTPSVVRPCFCPDYRKGVLRFLAPPLLTCAGELESVLDAAPENQPVITGECRVSTVFLLYCVGLLVAAVYGVAAVARYSRTLLRNRRLKRLANSD